MDKNPELIQDVDLLRDDDSATANSRPRVPLFLVHDGGGTTFAYHCLDPLRRPTYGLFNPCYRAGGNFEGGVRGMGRLYAIMIKQTCSEADFPSARGPDSRVDILIGGWSMGGILSLEIAKVLTNDQDVRVIGVLMMETMCPMHLPTHTNGGGGYVESLDHFGLGKKNKNLVLSMRAMKQALRLVREWEPPVWAADQQRPRVSLLRATEALLPAGNDKGVHILDIYRHDPKLGWDQYDPDLLTETLDVEGNHFEMFSFQHIPGISKTIKRCCDTLERLDRS
ncbi:thioesterase domain-containing protein [Xylaria scruposa]|nr:thioesterase domain-containing protein [Xylaria scruposa]